MSGEQAAVAARLVEAVNRRDLDRLADHLHPEFAFHALIGALEGRVYVGLDGLREFLADMDSTWEGYRVEQEGLHEAEDRIVLVLRANGTAKLGGVPMDQRLHVALQWRDGKLWRTVVYTDLAEALAAAGIRE